MSGRRLSEVEMNVRGRVALLLMGKDAQGVLPRVEFGRWIPRRRRFGNRMM